MNKLSSPQTFWQPEPNVQNHTGLPLTVDAQFFMPPPPEIGQLISAATTLHRDSKALPSVWRWAIIVGSGLLTTILLLMIGTEWPAFVFGAFMGWCCWLWTAFRHTCSYVGTKGVVRYDLRDSRSVTPRKDGILFADSTYLHAQTIHVHSYGIYSSTNYFYTWNRNTGGKFSIAGSYRNRKKIPKSTDLWYFGQMAESAWSSYLRPGFDDHLQKNGYVEFPYGDELKAVRIGSGYLEFVTSNDTVWRALVTDMHQISLKLGTLDFRHQDQQWWLGRGGFSFEYGRMANAQVFLIYLQELTGIS